jgi:membrane-bound serine protease (ClpP class)
MKAALLAALVFLATAASASAAGQVDVIPLHAAINPITANYVTHGLQQAAQDGAAAAVIELDTPGGLDSAMRQIVRAMSSSSVPVVVYVAPSGARAGSAGVFVTMASDVAAMAPNTNIGAAHPVFLPGGPGQGNTPGQDGVEATKVLNDSVAYIRALAEGHGRNADWAEKAVRESVSVSNQQAVEQGIVELQASNLADLTAKLDGRAVKRPDGSTLELRTAGAAINRIQMSPFEEVMSLLADPTVAYLLMLVGVYGVIFELSTPGAILPGVLGGLALILGLLALGTLPVNYAGLALIGFSFLLFVADVKMPTHGILTAGGVISFLLGSLALFNTGPGAIGISLPVVIAVTVVTAAFFATIIRIGVRARRARPVTGADELVGRVGEARSDLNPDGRVLINGEWWKASAQEPVEAGAKVEVVDVKGLILLVKRAA